MDSFTGDIISIIQRNRSIRLIHTAVRMHLEHFHRAIRSLYIQGADRKPEESIRLMLMDEAMNDLRAMYLLEGLTDRNTVLKCIERTPDEEVTF